MHARQLFIAVCLATWALCTQAAQRYAVVAQIDNLYPKALNNAGMVVGDMAVGQLGHAFLWSNSVLTDLGTLGFGVSSANGINELGQVVGNAEGPAGRQHIFLYASGRMVDLGSFDNEHIEAHALNNAGTIVGLYRRTGPEYRAFSLHEGELRDLGDFGAEPAYAADINERGDIAGSAGHAADSPRAHMHAFIHRSDRLLDLGIFNAAGAGSSLASAINDGGEVVGTAFGGAGEARAFLWRDGIMHNLGTLAGGASGASDINEAGQIVGASDGAAFLFDAGRMLDLNLLAPIPGWRLVNGVAINESGHILAYGCRPDATCASFLLQAQALAIPEPASASMLACGLVLLGWRIRARTTGNRSPPRF